MNIFCKKIIKTEFRNIPPHNIDTSLFDASSFKDISANGYKICPLKVLHSSAVHYQGRFRNIKSGLFRFSESLRFFNAAFDIFPSFQDLPEDDNFYLNNTETNEFQTRSSEVISVGLSVSSVTELFLVNRNRIQLIEGTRKRLDFSFEKNGSEILFESKGRKPKGITSAINDIFDKKRNYPNDIKYGVLSSLPRNYTPVSMVVVDPETNDKPVNRDQLIIRLLKYYSKQALLAGYWRLSDLLNERIELFEIGLPVSEFENMELDYQNFSKLGQAYKVNMFNNGQNIFEFSTFVNAYKEIRHYMTFDDRLLIYGLDKELIYLLEKQDYSALIKYSCSLGEEVIKFRNGEDVISINNDGSVMGVVNPNGYFGRLI